MRHAQLTGGYGDPAGITVTTCQLYMDAMRHAQLTGGYGDPGGAGVAKTSSAFSPIQGSMLQTAAAAQAAQGFAMSAGSRGYSFYDPIGFPKHHSQVGFD